jgi:hypothetical protein
MLTLAGCESGNPTGVPYRELGRDLAGVYTPATPGTNLGLRLVLGTRHTLTGRYAGASGEIIRFEGTWERDGPELFVTLRGPDGLPVGMDFDVTKEKVRTLIPRSRFDLTPEYILKFFEQNIMRLRGVAVVNGIQLELNLIRIISDVVSVSGPRRS